MIFEYYERHIFRIKCQNQIKWSTFSSRICWNFISMRVVSCVGGLIAWFSEFTVTHHPIQFLKLSPWTERIQSSYSSIISLRLCPNNKSFNEFIRHGIYLNMQNDSITLSQIWILTSQQFQFCATTDFPGILIISSSFYYSGE